MAKRIGEHVRGNVVAYVALFFALGMGTAWALERNSVRSKHIVNGQVKPRDLNAKNKTLWALVDGGTDTIIRSSPGVRMADVKLAPSENYINFNGDLRRRALHITPQWPDTGGGSAVICGDNNDEQVLCALAANNPQTAYVTTDGNINYYISASPKH